MGKQYNSLQGHQPADYVVLKPPAVPGKPFRTICFILSKINKIHTLASFWHFIP